MNDPRTLARCLERIGPVAALDPDACWHWPGGLDRKGYGKLTIKLDGKHFTRAAHRVAYEALIGPIPDGLVLDHLCRVRRCVNPAHLEPVTVRENVRRGLLMLPRVEREINAAGHPVCHNGHEVIGGNAKRRCSGPHIVIDCVQCTQARRERSRARRAA